MASLAGRSLVSSYKELLKLNNATLNSGVSASLQTVEDGFAGATALQLSSAGLASTGTLATTGDFSVNTNKFNVTASSGNTAVAGTLASVGDFSVNTNKFTVAAASGNTSVAGTLNVTGTSTLAAVGGTTGSFSQTLASTGDFSVNTNKFNVTAASGNTLVAGTLGVSGATSLSSTLGVTGATTLSSTLGLAGNLAINTDKFNVTASSGDTSVAGTLTVTGPGVTAYFNSTGAIRLPQGIDGQRPAGQAGMLRFNTGSQSFEGHNGTLWGAIGGSGSGGSSQYVRETFTATAGQTTFTVTGGYTPERIDVFQNGVKLVNGSGNDVTVTSGTNIVLATGAAAGDIIDVVGLASGNFAGPATAKRQNFTATANQTVFTVTGGYTPGQLDVFQNGTKLLNAVDVDVSNGSTFTLTTGANAGDSVEVVGFTAADTISGTLKFQNGTAAAPSITNYSDTDTGLFFPAANELAVATNGAERFRVSSSAATFATQAITIAGTASTPAIVPTGNTNTGIFFPAADTIAFSEGGAEAMRIDSSGRVGIGTQNLASYNNAGDDLVVGNHTGAHGLTICSENNTSGYIFFADGTGAPASYAGQISYNHTDNAMFFGTLDGTERLRIDSSGNVLIGKNSATANGGDLQISGGITFPASQSAKSDANTLDDYEEGTAGISLTPGGGSLGTTTVSARYTKIGRVVTILADITVGTVSSPTGTLKITSLPFAALGTTIRGAQAFISRNGFNLSSLGAGKIFANIEANANEADIYFMLNNGNSREFNLAPFVNSDATFNLSFTYFTN